MSAAADTRDACAMPFQASATSFGCTPGTYGPLKCGCVLNVIPFDPLGPRLLILGGTHKHGAHDVKADFPEAWS